MSNAGGTKASVAFFIFSYHNIFFLEVWFFFFFVGFLLVLVLVVCRLLAYITILDLIEMCIASSYWFDNFPIVTGCFSS